MTDEQQRAADKAEYARILSDWEQMGFIRPGWSIFWDGGEGCWRMEFEQTTNKRIYVLTETAMDYFVVGVAEWAAFMRGKPPKPSLKSLRWPIERLNPQTGVPWTPEERRAMGIGGGDS